MKALIISDVHSNLPALLAVFRAVQRKPVDLLFCLGDLVGYGAQPNQVLDRLRRFGAERIFVRGNHDRAGSGESDAAGFNQVAMEAVLWTRNRLTPANRGFLRSLPLGPVVRHGVTICHGSLADEDEYLLSSGAARRSFELLGTSIGLFGHTHLPTAFEIRPDGHVEGRVIRKDATLKLDPTARYLLNPGSVGQPRDRNPEAAYAILDLTRRSIRFRRVPYDIEAAQDGIRKAGLPEILATRLAAGF